MLENLNDTKMKKCVLLLRSTVHGTKISISIMIKYRAVAGEADCFSLLFICSNVGQEFIYVASIFPCCIMYEA